MISTQNLNRSYFRCRTEATFATIHYQRSNNGQEEIKYAQKMCPDKERDMKKRIAKKSKSKLQWRRDREERREGGTEEERQGKERREGERERKREREREKERGLMCECMSVRICVRACACACVSAR
eukprot:6211930-Pleurochrysis_carterae.AAC.5